ncbi:MAG TPA: alpha/beta hydrolase [Burkholderiales bacterium]|jgi:pimeloyl-ACP methyl ester carboxylesterase|nr:alpha/beta hydrolase [Burkholderiales bacterium]
MSDTGPGSTFVQAGGVRLHYNDIGQGTPVVCLHGGGPGASGWSNFSQNVPALSARFRLLLVDMPQFGHSEKVVFKEGRLTYVARVLKDFLDQLGVARPHFIGNSMGAQTAFKFAIDYADRIDRLVAMGNGSITQTVFTPRPTEGVKLIQAFYKGAGPSPEKLRRLIETLVYDASFLTEELLAQRFAAANDPETVALWSKNPPANEDIGALLDKVACRTLLVWGLEDRFSPIEGGLALLKRLKDARLHVFAKCGHWAQVEKAREFERLTLDFLQGD